MKSEELKKIVKEKYSDVVIDRARIGESSCCRGEIKCDTDCQSFSLDYSELQGYNPNADYNLGCGIPTEFAMIKPGDSVLDLGSGAGNDCFVARALVGETGKVAGIDFTDKMVAKAKGNLEKLGYDNMEFVLGDIENMPFPKNVFDVVISNCVLNLVPNKKQAYDEIYRVLKPNGHFCISDIVLVGDLPENIREAAEMYAGCVSGAIEKENYISIINSVGFDKICVKNEREIFLSDELLLRYLDKNELDVFRNSGAGVISITITAIK
jgi:SAM-dependent methyltransferase